MKTENKSNFVKYSIIGIFTFLSIIGSTLLYQKIYYENSIQDYKPSRDRQFILDLFKNNWYWLTANDSLSPETVLDTRSASEFPNKGNLIIKVYLENNQPTGFIAYYTKQLYQGTIQFMAVDERFRGKGYAQKLLSYALDDLKHMGCINVKLLTRMSNTSARAVYTKAGFKEFWSDDQFIKYQKYLT